MGKRLRNKIAGFTTHLMKRIQKGPVRGISLKLQEEERERRMEYVPDRSELDTDQIHIDADTKEMLREMNMGSCRTSSSRAPPLVLSAHSEQPASASTETDVVGDKEKKKTKKIN